MNWAYLVLSYLGLVSVGLLDNARGSLYYDILKDLNLSASIGSQIFALASIASLVALLTSRWWLQSFDLLRSHGALLLIQAVGCFGFGYAGTTDNPTFLILFFSFVFGLSLGGTSITVNLLITRGAPVHQHRKSFSGLHAMYGIASFLSPLIISIMYSSNIHWTQCFMIFATLPLAAGIGSFYKSKNQKIQPDLSHNPTKVAFKIRFLFGAIFSLYVASEIAISSRLVLYLTDYTQLEGNLARSYLSLFFALMLFGRIGFGAIKLPQSNYYWLKVSLACSFLFALIGLFIHPIGLALCGLSMSFFFPCGMSWVNEKSKQEAEQLISTIMTGIGVMLIIMHWSAGIITTLLNIHYALMIILLFLGISFLVLLKTEKS